MSYTNADTMHLTILLKIPSEFLSARLIRRVNGYSTWLMDLPVQREPGLKGPSRPALFISHVFKRSARYHNVVTVRQKPSFS